MLLAETVTFGGSDLDRAAELRGDPAALAQMTGNPSARSILFWRGKPLMLSLIHISEPTRRS